MTKRIAAKHKIDRRLGVNLWGSAKSPLAKRNYGPGQHGERRKGKLSNFGVQLQAKQKLKGYYGNVTEKQFARYYHEAVRMRGDSSQNLIGLLERRLDAVIYRGKFAPTVFSARQLINHGHVLVNGRRVDIPSCLIKPGDKVELTQKAQSMALIANASANQERSVPEYLIAENQSIEFKRVPQLLDVPYPVQMEPNLVIEFYSR